MNAFNRIVTIIVLFILLALLLALAVSPMEVVHWMQGQLATFGAWLARLQATDPMNFNIARAALAVAALIVLLPLILAEFTREGEAVVRLRTPEGDAQVTTDSIAKRLAWHVDQLADVIAVQPVVQARGDQVNIQLDVETSPVIDVPMKTEEILLVVRDVVEGSMGLKIGKIDVRIRHSEYPELA
jgi:hypothetical protein